MDKPEDKSEQFVLRRPTYLPEFPKSVEISKQKWVKFKKKKSKKKSKSNRKRVSRIKPGDRIEYRNLSLISRFISDEGKILSRRVNRLTLKQQRLITLAIKQARFLSLLPFLHPKKKDPKKKDPKKKDPKKKDTKKKEKPFERTRPKSTPGAKNQKGLITNKKKQGPFKSEIIKKIGLRPQGNKRNQNSNL